MDHSQHQRSRRIVRLFFQNAFQIRLSRLKLPQLKLVPSQVAPRRRIAWIQAQSFFEVDVRFLKFLLHAEHDSQQTQILALLGSQRDRLTQFRFGCFQLTTAYGLPGSLGMLMGGNQSLRRRSVRHACKGQKGHSAQAARQQPETFKCQSNKSPSHSLQLIELQTPRAGNARPWLTI